MGYARIKNSGNLIFTRLKGAARSGGVSSTFGIASEPGGGGPTYESVTWPQEPVDTDNNDGTQAYNMGIAFELVAGKNCTGVKWRVPDVVTNTPPGGSHVASIWRVSDTTRLVFKNFTPVTGGYQEILFDTPVALSAGVDYIVAIYTIHYVYRSGTSSVISPSGNLVVQGGKLVDYNGGPNIYPSGSYDSWYYISPIVEV